MIRLIRAVLVFAFCLSPILASAKTKATDSEIVEVKCLVPEDKIADVSGKLGLASKPPKKIRVVCFFDTASMALFNHIPKLILRSRYDSSETDTTVKVRGGKVSEEGVECEFDRVCGRDRTEACSVNDEDQKKGEIKTANRGTDVKKIFSKKQEAVAESVFGKLKWDELKPFGPVKNVQIWKDIAVPGGEPVTVERWELPARPGKPARVLFEVSAKVSFDKEAQTLKQIEELVGAAKSETGESEAKTGIVLEHFAGHSP